MQSQVDALAKKSNLLTTTPVEQKRVFIIDSKKRHK